MKIKDKKFQELMSKLGECDVITFDPKEIAERIASSYGMKEQAHDLLLQADVLLDGVLKDLSGIKSNGKNKTGKGRKTN